MSNLIYQKIIDELCEMYQIPSIPVFVVPRGELKDCQAYFDTEKYIIKVEEDTTYLKLVHEWVHYCIRLFTTVGDLEEKICDWAPVGIESDAEEEYPRLHKLFKMLPREKGEDPEDPEDSEPERV